MKASTATVTDSLRIVIVENHADTLRCLESFLHAMGHTVLSARSMKEALALLPVSDCDVLLSDIGLPDGDGWLLLENLHLKKPIFAIAMSGFGMSADHDRSKAAGYRHHLLKPFFPEDLEPLLAEAAREKESGN
jgi:CheY-like chemotaxis protein